MIAFSVHMVCSDLFSERIRSVKGKPHHFGMNTGNPSYIFDSLLISILHCCSWVFMVKVYSPTQNIVVLYNVCYEL